MEYADEPRLIFSPLNEEDYCIFYNLEMAGFVDDLPFYTTLLQNDDYVLELGCGTGRLTRLLAGSCRHITGIDRSPEMLRIAAINRPANVTYRLMDMSQLSFSSSFDVILIPYNTINLLGDRTKIEQCLQLCRSFLTQAGRLAIQAYHPDHATRETSEARKQFQFTIFEDYQDGRVIKETLKWYEKENSTLNLEERYRVRPGAGSNGNRDLRHSFKLYTPNVHTLKILLQECGFSIKNIHGNATGKSFDDDRDTSLFIHAETA